MKRLLTIPIAAFFLLLVAGWGEQPKAGTDGDGFNLDHFKCYKVKGDAVQPNPTPTVEDQFEVDTDKLLKPFMICNPASKNGEMVSNPSEHLVCYKAKGELKLDRKLTVVVSNQFTTQVLEVAREEKVFCVPSSKNCVDAAGEFTLCPNEPFPAPPVSECFKEAACANAETCETGDGCFGACFFTAAGNTQCFAGEFGCNGSACTTDADCPDDFACSDTCCGLQCAPLCGIPFPLATATEDVSVGTSSK